MLKHKSMLIVKALFKHGYSKFRLEILEYCGKENLLKREQHYLDKLKPEYNILTTAGSNFGFKHSEETLARLRGRKLPHSTRALMKEKAIGRHIGRKHTEETLKKMSEVKKGEKNPSFGKNHLEETKAKLSAANGTAIKVFDKETNVTSYYTSMRKAAEAVGVGNSTLSYQFKKSSCICLKGRHLIEKIQID
jgi:group I intron endonuclease